MFMEVSPVHLHKPESKRLLKFCVLDTSLPPLQFQPLCLEKSVGLIHLLPLGGVLK